MIKDVSKVPVRPGETLAAAIIRCYHEAFIVQTIGAAAGGISVAEFRALQDCGLVEPGVQYADRPAPPDNEFLIVSLAAAYQARAPIEKHEEIRHWPYKQWEIAVPVISPQITITWKPQQQPAAPRSTFEVVHSDLTPREQIALERVTRDTADFIRGLGNVITQDWDNAKLEVWRETLPLEIPDPIKRRERIASIRAVLKQAVEQRWSPQKTASEMAKATQDYARNWRRVAETELQGLFNDAAVIGAVRTFGLDVRIARIPETTACKWCLSLFLDANKTPILFNPVELARNGVNVGKPTSMWKATIYPVHPRCRCGVQAVPPGYTITRFGRLTKEQPVP